MMQNSSKKVQNLEKRITAGRKRLHELWDARGYTDADVLKASIELDILLNLYYNQKIKIKPVHTE